MWRVCAGDDQLLAEVCWAAGRAVVAADNMVSHPWEWGIACWAKPCQRMLRGARHGNRAGGHARAPQPGGVVPLAVPVRVALHLRQHAADAAAVTGMWRVTLSRVETLDYAVRVGVSVVECPELSMLSKACATAGGEHLKKFPTLVLVRRSCLIGTGALSEQDTVGLSVVLLLPYYGAFAWGQNPIN